jgi:hypothetical protein
MPGFPTALKRATIKQRLRLGALEVNEKFDDYLQSLRPKSEVAEL